jgi:hypothetical protein
VMRRGLFLVVSKGSKLSRVFLHSIGILNLDVNLGRAAFAETLMLTGGGGSTLERNFLIFMLTLGGLHVRIAVQHEIWVPTQHLI